MAKKIPMRMCVSCRERFAKKDLIRIVASTDGTVQVDPTGRMPGRGAYVCAAEECIAKARKTGILSRSLKAEVPPELFETLLQYVKEEHE